VKQVLEQASRYRTVQPLRLLTPLHHQKGTAEALCHHKIIVFSQGLAVWKYPSTRRDATGCRVGATDSSGGQPEEIPGSAPLSASL